MGQTNFTAVGNVEAVQLENIRPTAVVMIPSNTGITAVFEGSIDNVNWFPVLAYKTDATSPVTATTAGETGIWRIQSAGLLWVRARCTVVAVPGTSNCLCYSSFSGAPFR